MTSFGTDIQCIADARDMIGLVSGVMVVAQSAIHRLTADSVLGPGGNNWGYDVRKLVGMSATDLVSVQPILAGVLMRDPRIKQASVVIEQSARIGLINCVVRVACETAEGTFKIVLPVSDVSSATIEVQS
jgi:hypothetical protein